MTPQRLPLQQIALIGNPNSGKTTLFNKLTGAQQHVGNWPGVTVDKKTGHYRHQQQRINVVDLPGTYALESLEDGVSQDELVVRQFVQHDQDSLIVNVVDATNLHRNLYLTTQLVDLGRPMLVVLNLMDALARNGEVIDLKALAQQLGCPVIGISANKSVGLTALKDLINQALAEPTPPQPLLNTLSPTQSAALDLARANLADNSPIKQYSRWQLLDALLQPEHAPPAEQPDLKRIASALQPQPEDLDMALASSRYDCIDALTRSVISQPRAASASLTERIDALALGRLTGLPFFLLAMYLMFLLAINIGSAFIDFFDILAATVLVDGSTYLLQQLHAPAWLITILANGVGTGIQTVASFIPVIAAMFLCLSFMEDSGYLARAAMVVDRGMRTIGLPGKAFVPMLVGFGCNVPAIMGTRTLESPRDRLMAIMMIPYMSCGARLPVYALFAAAFFPRNGQNVVFLLYLLGILVAIITGLMLKHSILPGGNTPFIMELPAYRLPTARNIAMLTWSRLKSFILQAGKAIVIMVVGLSLLNSLGSDGSFGNENTDRSVLANIGKGLTPAFSPMGVDQDNWPATVGIFTGIFAKEAVIGTLNALYSQMGSDAADNGDSDYDLMAGVRAALASVPENLSTVIHNLADPLGINQQMADGDLATVMDENEIDNRTITQMHLAFGSSAAAIAYLMFILLYTPCAAALGAVYREAGSKWTLIVALWSWTVAWLAATAYYQSTRLTLAPQQASIWLIGIALFVLLCFAVLRLLGKRLNATPVLKPSKPRDGDCCGGGCH